MTINLWKKVYFFIQYYHVQDFLTLNLILQLYFFTSKDYILSIGKSLSNIDRNETKKKSSIKEKKKNIQNKTSSNRFFQFHLRSQFYGLMALQSRCSLFILIIKKSTDKIAKSVCTCVWNLFYE